METEVTRLAANPEDARRLQWGTWAASAALLLVLAPHRGIGHYVRSGSRASAQHCCLARAHAASLRG